MNNSAIACGICGFALGTGMPGSSAWCDRCQEFVVSRAVQQDWGGVVAGLAAVAAGIVIVAALAKALKS